MTNKMTFFMIYAEGKTSPTKKYDNIDDAKTEAKRLCEMLNVECFIMESIYSVELAKFKEYKFDTIPF